MAGAVEQTRAGASRRARGATVAPLAVALLSLLALVAYSPPSKAEAKAHASNCPTLPSTLSPSGPGPSRFTMLLRINQQVNVDTWTNFDESTGGLGDRVRAQDVFVINTRYQNTTPAIAETLANNLRAAFPCNRIVALNGMSFNPAAPGYAYSLIANPNVSALMTDYEQDDWNSGRGTDPSRPPWTYTFNSNFPLLKGWTNTLNAAVSTNPAAVSKRTGLVPQDISGWNYGQIAQILDKRNRRLGATHIGPLSVQTQDSCANGGASGFGARAKNLRLQYKYKFITRKIRVPGKTKRKKVTIRRKIKPQGRPLMTNLSLQISFNENPVKNSSMAIMKTSATTAASCVPAGLKQGGGAFFFFASDDAMRLLFQQPQVAALRPQTVAGTAGTGGVGAP